MKRTISLPPKASLLTLFALWWLIPPGALGQQEPKPSQIPPVSATSAQGSSTLPLEQQLALSLLRQLASDLKGEADKPAAALIQAQVADTLWRVDEVEARSLFRLAFDTAKQPIPESSVIDKEARARYVNVVRRQASAIKEIIGMFGNHDRPTAEHWLESLNEEQTAKDPSTTRLSRERAEFLIQLALQQAKTNPEEAQKLGLASLAGDEIPSAFIQLLFALKRIDPSKSDVLFRAAIAALRRNSSSGGLTLGILSNYLFFSGGRLFEKTSAPDAALFIDYVMAAANTQVAILREARGNKGPMPESGVRLTNFLATGGLAIVSNNAPDKLPILQPLFNELSSGLNQQQLDDLALMSTGLRQQDAMEAGATADLDTQIQRAEHEKDAVVRDYMWRSLAIGTMRGDPERALSFAGKIDDESMRAQTEDDVNLVVASQTVRGAAYEEARKVALRFHDTNLRSRTLAELADRALSRDRQRAADLLSESYEVASKGEPTADRAAITLILAQKFAKFDLQRSFELLAAAIKTINQIPNVATAPAGPPQRSGVRVFSFTMVGGAELTTGDHATLDSLSFQGLGTLVGSDYFRARNLGDDIQNKTVRARYLLAIARNVLDSPRPN